MEARNIFCKGVESGILKYSTGYNHYEKNNAINKGLVGNRCSQYDREETWEHTILYEGGN